jgi:multiple sugar transport system substrate-binding protein
MLRALFSLSHPASLEWGPPQTLDYMSSNDDVIYCPLLFGYANYARDGFAPHLVQFTTIPAAGARGRGGAILGGTGLGVSAYRRHLEAATALALWLCGPEVQSGPYVMAGGQPGNRGAWTDPTVNTVCHDFFTGTLETLEQAFLRPRYDGFVAFQDQAGDLLHGFLRDGSDIDSVIDGLDTLYRTSQPAGDAAW